MTLRAMFRHWDVEPSLRKARCAGVTIRFSNRVSPILFARILDVIFPNSWSTEIGLISDTRSENDPSSLFFGIIETMAFLHDSKDFPYSREIAKILLLDLFAMLTSP